MKVLFQVKMDQSKIDALIAEGINQVENDFYSRVSNASASVIGIWSIPGNWMCDLDSAIHDVPADARSHERRRKPGYRATALAVSYASCRGNISWIKNLGGGMLEVGFQGRRHGNTLHWVCPNGLMEVLYNTTPTVYVTQEPEWHWAYTSPQAPQPETEMETVQRITGHDFIWWSEVPVQHRAARLAEFDLDKAIKDRVIAL